MALVSLQNITFGYGGRPLLEDAGLQIESGERVCCIGRNGAGKSTLMRLLAGEITPDSGEFHRQKGLRVARLHQEVPLGAQGKIFDVVAEALQDRAVSHAPAESESWQWRTKVEAIISRMDLDPAAEFASLSGGMRRRVFLARALVGEPDILLLDEPTNHLDIPSIAWLEDFLLRYAGTVFFVTHDRMFLRRLATRIVELEGGRILNWACDYDKYLERRQAVWDAEEAQKAEFEKKLAREEVWIRKGVKARRARNEGRVRALEAMRNERRSWRVRQGEVNMQTQAVEKSGRLVIEAENIAFGHGEEPIVKEFSTLVVRGDRIGILGPNGSGKTTLLRLLLGDLSPQAGWVKLGTSLEVAYFDQLRAQLREDATVLESVSDGNEYVVVNGARRHISSYLKDFLFSPDQARSRVSQLSGGERNRLLLARLFTRPSNLLILDEPTNDLDVETLEMLEDFLLDYTGTVLMVSHDRAFLNNVVTAIWSVEGGGKVKEYVGGYDDWLRQRPGSASRDTPSGSSPSGKLPSGGGTMGATASKSGGDAGRGRPAKLSYKERQELQVLPVRIESLEGEQAELIESMANPGFYKQSGDAIASAKSRLADLEKELAEVYSRWEALDAIEPQSPQMP